MKSDATMDKTKSSSDPHAYTPPSPTDVRSACPGLNTLANHRYLPHSGRGITRDLAIRAMHDGLNVGPDIGNLLWNGTHFWKLTHKDSAGVEMFDLDEVSRHGGIEHDGSLTRADARTGDNHSIDHDMVDKFMWNFGGTAVTAGTAARVLQNRIEGNKREFGAKSDGNTWKSNVFSWGNVGMIFGTMGDIWRGEADAKIVEAFLHEERLPVELGWKRATVTTDLVNLNVLIAKMQLSLGMEALGHWKETLKCLFWEILRWK